MKKFFAAHLKILAFSGYAASILLLLSCGDNPGDKTDVNTEYTDTISVKAEKVQLRELNFVKTFSGTLEGEEQANIVSKIPERITAVKVKVDNYVKAGTVLFELDKGGASSQFYQTQAVFLNAEKDLQRMKNLFNEGAVSKQALDQVQTGYDVAKANFEAAKSTVEITSPLSGFVTAINVNIGDIANPAIVLATVSNIRKMKAKFNIGESDVQNLYVGQPVEIYSELNPGLLMPGKITQISKSADIQSRTFEVKAVFSNTKDSWFKPGMFCRTNVNLKTKNASLTVPAAAVMNNNNMKGVFVVINNKAAFKEIKEGMSDGKFVEILSGVNENDMVVTLGMNKLKEGTVVLLNNN